MSTLIPTRAPSYLLLGVSGEQQHERDLEALVRLDLEWAIPTAQHPNVERTESNRVLLGEGKLGTVWRYNSKLGTPRAYKIIRPRDVPGFDNITAVTDLRLSDFILNAEEAQNRVSRQTRELNSTGYTNITYEALAESYIPCQEVDIGSIISWLSNRASFMNLGDTSNLEKELLEQIGEHKGGLVSLINSLAEFINENYVGNHYTKSQAELYAQAYGLPIESIREINTTIHGQDITIYQVPLIPFKKIFPEHEQAGINSKGEWFTVMELLQPSMGDTMEEVAEAFEKLGTDKKKPIDIQGIMQKVQEAFDFKQLKIISLMLDFIHICGLTISDLKPDNITHDLSDNLVIADLSAIQRIGGRRLYGSPRYMSKESLEIAQRNSDLLVGNPADDTFALQVIKAEWEAFLGNIPQLTEQATLRQYMQSQKIRRQESENSTMELILHSKGK